MSGPPRRVRLGGLVSVALVALVAACDGGGLSAEDAAWCDSHRDVVLRTGLALGITPDDTFIATQRAFLDRDAEAIARFADALRADASAWSRACREATDLL